MMRISTRGRYALRAMVDVVQHCENGPVARQDIAARQAISAYYVAQLFRQLQAAGLVEGVKGPGGGYRLARDSARITVGDILQAVEGPVALVHCVPRDDDAEPLCDRIAFCTTHSLWQQLSEAVADLLDSVTLQDLAYPAQQTVQGYSPPP